MRNPEVNTILATIIDKTSEITGVPPSEIKSRSKLNERVKSRAMVYFAMRTYFDVTLEEIGRYFGRTHATVVCAINKVEDYSHSSLTFRIHLNLLLEYVRANRDGIQDGVILRSRMEFLQEQLSA